MDKILTFLGRYNIMLKWYSMTYFPEDACVFVYFEDGIEYGIAKEGKLDIGGTLFDIEEALWWTYAPVKL